MARPSATERSTCRLYLASVQDRVAFAERLLHGQQMPTGATACMEVETDEAKLRESSAKFGPITSAKVG